MSGGLRIGGCPTGFGYGEGRRMHHRGGAKRICKEYSEDKFYPVNKKTGQRKARCKIYEPRTLEYLQSPEARVHYLNRRRAAKCNPWVLFMKDYTEATGMTMSEVLKDKDNLYEAKKEYTKYYADYVAKANKCREEKGLPKRKTKKVAIPFIF